MITFRKIALLAFVLAAVPAAASAEKSDKQWAHERVTFGLVKPLDGHEAERSKFSRVRQPPRERRVRVLSPSAVYDDKGRAFLTYAIDSRFGKDWRQDYTGCVYRKTGQIYVGFDDEYLPAELLLGKDVEAVPGVCVPRRDPQPRA